ncbi:MULTISPECIES: NUDIX hydrolase [Methylobacterium]|uniref:8-oxo-dGTP diphosphatase 2 n=1 Tax=Methylobacterium thuringiense TaxID=1003091 RepID=A0ABQ4TL39_9HYPH|nr:MULTISPECIES: NUDIX hydrolase [Methylobacterium]TXN19352.1 NUDIX hydrolase [Methylobacterium sp. WL9]GJE55706.1 Putative 8-oxo-dGTP diphosphatase 2 [Methylobacterium thuringiense]
MTNDDRLFPTRPYIGVSIAVVRDGLVLLAARANPPMQGVWTLPGGLVEAGEPLADAAIRELQEEVGVVAAVVGTSLTPTEIILRDEAGRLRHHFVIHPHAATWLSGEPKPGPEALDVRWVRLDDIAELETTPGLAGTLAEAISRVNGGV